MALPLNLTRFSPPDSAVSFLNASQPVDESLGEEPSDNESSISSWINSFWFDRFNATSEETSSTSPLLDTGDWADLSVLNTNTSAALDTSTLPLPSNYSSSFSTASPNRTLPYTELPTALPPPPPTMAPTQSLSTLATNFVNNLFGGDSNGNRAAGSLTSPRPSSNPEVFIYDGPTSAESDEMEGSNSVLSNITSFFGSGSPTVGSSTTAIVTEEDPELGVPLGGLSSQCYSSPEDYELFTAMLCSSLLVLGVVYFTYGYRCFRMVALFVGLAFGTALAYAVCTAEHLIDFPYGNLVVALASGLVVGLLTMLVITIGLFVIGLHLGLLLGTGLLTVIYLLRPFFDVLQPPLSALTLLIFFVAVGLVGAFSTIYFSKGCTIIASSLYGSALTLLCADYFVENFKIVHWFLDNLSNGDDWYGLLAGTNRGVTLCLGSYILLSLWPGLTLLGIIIQGCITGKGVQFRNEYGVVASTPATMILRSGNQDITSTSRDPSQRSSYSGKSQEDVRLEQKHRKYRYLYQVRTAHGDVISQHYFQSMQNKSKLCLPDQDSYTFNSDLSSHFLPEPGSRTTTLSAA